ncbi:MAG: RNA polymerase sigma-54 factor [Planctomycetota bacterium]|nr:MAG: RNA polymerase sigma-54 factor [Planctomycetota bacterium]REJ98579.1 MAG: RNA polymerase sigma-54 factor [Planctomycetota bacterium]REK29879.1 MAG: RNA polymerase sigma-54 factor [Planctomycetota bacterium]REK47951.1 MAG: RNA polymerase sigma-54 factor [Planctomycetota bacterium]
MRLTFGQEMRMVQKQVLAPRMIQSMEILQLPLLALQERIEQEVQENPLLEVHEEDPDLPEEKVEAENPDAPTTDEKELVVDESKNNEEDFERLLDMNDQLPEYFEERTRPSTNRIEEEGSRKHDTLANMVDRPESLQDYLHHQLYFFEIDPDVRQLCDRIIYNLDDNGYLPGRLEDLLEPDAPKSRLAQAEAALAVVQKLDPPGIAARDERECLLMQLTPGMPYYEELRTLISNHLEDLAHNRLPLISKKTGYSIEKIHEVWAELKKLNPWPGALFASSVVQTVTPDVTVEEDEQGRYKLRIEDDRTPSLFISPYYRKLLSNPETSPETREYIKRKINAAQWLIESIEQRRSTLTRVAQAIVDHQQDFLAKGPEAIEPLKMQQIADRVGVHVTTVSRAVDDKWIQTPRGIFPLKRFFVGGTVGADGEEVAWDAVRIKLQEIVDGEDKQKPLSDDELVKELNKHGIKVARRTVTKYRKSMNIPSSRQRRDWLAKENVAQESGGVANRRVENGKSATAEANGEPLATPEGEDSFSDGAMT